MYATTSTWSTWRSATCAALEKLVDSPGVLTCNLGTGRGYSVLDMVRAFEAACGRAIPYPYR